MYWQEQLSAIDLISIISCVIGFQNLQENREQSAHNDVQAANDGQAKYLLDELKQMFENQNTMLKGIAKQLDRMEWEIRQLRLEGNLRNVENLRGNVW